MEPDTGVPPPFEQTERQIPLKTLPPPILRMRSVITKKLIYNYSQPICRLLRLLLSPKAWRQNALFGLTVM